MTQSFSSADTIFPSAIFYWITIITLIFFRTVNEPCIVHQDCNGDSLECINLKCEYKKSKKLKDIGVQTSITNVEIKNVSTSIDNSNLFTKTEKAENDDTMCKMNNNLNIL